MATAGLLLGGTAAHAESRTVSGEVGLFSTSLVIGASKFTMARAGNIEIKYTDGLGLANSIRLRMGVRDEKTGNQFANTVILGPQTGGTYTLATNVRAGTEFRLQWRAEVGFVGNNGWGGVLRWG